MCGVYIFYLHLCKPSKGPLVSSQYKNLLFKKKIRLHVDSELAVAVDMSMKGYLFLCNELRVQPAFHIELHTAICPSTACNLSWIHV